MKLNYISYVGYILYVLTSILWTIFAVKMNNIIWNEKKFIKLIILNLLLTPISIILWIIGGSEVVRKRLIIAKEITEIKKRKNK